VIRIATAAPFLAGEFKFADPDAYEIIEWLWLELGDVEFSIRPELFRDLDWLDDRIWAAMRRLFSHEILAEVAETIH
jgi:hypothetical protein